MEGLQSHDTYRVGSLPPTDDEHKIRSLGKTRKSRNGVHASRDHCDSVNGFNMSLRKG